MKTITASALLVFAIKVAGQSYRTLRHSRPFVVDVVDGAIVFYPESGVQFRMETDDYVRCFNQHNSLTPGDYPKHLWSNSYFVALVDAMLKGTKPIADRTDVQSDVEKPEPPSPALDAKVRQLRLKGKMAAPVGQKSPRMIEVKSLQTVRDPAVKAWVLNVSEGRCSYCLEPAPFKDDDGKPFLEVHHVRQLDAGGSDTIDNVVALCPNCHRACHYSRGRKKIVAQLYKRYARLKK